MARITQKQTAERLAHALNITFEEALRRTKALHAILRKPDVDKVVILSRIVKKEPRAASFRTGKQRQRWSSARKIHLRSSFVDRNSASIFEGSDGVSYSQHQLEENVATGRWWVSSDRKSKKGRTVTVLARRA